jgi:hypothetical protein
MGPTEYCTTILLAKLHITSPVSHCWNKAFRIVGFLGRSPNVNSSWCREQCEGRRMWPYLAGRNYR